MNIRLFQPLLGAFLLCLMALSSVAKADRIVAVVNDQVILQSELERQLDQIMAEMRSRGTVPPAPEVLIPQLLNRQILQLIQLQVASRSGLEIGDEALNLTLENIATRNGLSLSGLKQAVEADGLSFETFREDIRTEMLLTNLKQRDVINRIAVSDREIENFLARQKTLGGDGSSFHLRHIMISLSEGAAREDIDEATARAEGLLAQLAQGADFAQLAINHSDGQNALQGGDLGWRELGTLPNLFADAAATLQPGEYSGILRSSTGLHILFLEELKQQERHMVEQRKARHILIQVDELVSSDEALQRITGLRDRIEVGESFTELARAHSDDPGSAINGGDLGWVTAGQMVDRFEAALKELQIGQISKPVRTEFGWHLIQLTDIRQIDDTEEQLRRRAASQIRARKADQEIAEWLQRMRDEAFVEIRI